MKLSFSRQILPIMAVVFIIISAIIIWQSQPDNDRVEPLASPLRAPQSASGNVVAGVGLVEPASELIEIGPHLPGIIARVNVAAGDQVQKGQVLFVIDRRDAEAAVNEAAARVKSLKSSISAARTRLATSQRQLALYGNVEDKRAFSQSELIERRGASETAAAELSVAQSQLVEAEAQLARARVTLERHQVRAPISGEILQVHARPGQYASASGAAGQGGGNGDALIVMGQTNPLHVRIDVDENEIARLDLGKAATVSARGNATRRYRARFVRMEPLVIPKKSLTNDPSERVDVRVMQLIFALDEGERDLVVGQQVDSYLPAKQTPSEKRRADGKRQGAGQ